MITALTENSARGELSNRLPHYVPYRESKLTTILKQSLGGSSFTLMIACLAPSDLFIDENISTLNYAARAAKIRNAPSVNMDPKSKKIADQQAVIERLKTELKHASDQIRYLMSNCDCHSNKLKSSSQKLANRLTINNNYSNNTF